MIRWTRSDIAKLSRAVSDFNKKRNKLDDIQKDLIKEVSYQDIKKETFTRNQLNKVIRELKNFKEEGQENIVNLENGVSISNWELNILQRNQKIVTRKLKRKAQAGDVLSDATLKSIQNVSTKNPLQFFDSKQNIFNFARLDHNYWCASKFRDFFIDTIKDVAEHYENKDILLEKLETIKDPLKFYEYIKKSDVFMDIQVWYDTKNGLVIGKASNEEYFNLGLQELKLIEEE